MRLLHAGPDHECRGSHRRGPCRKRSRAHPRTHERQPLPLRRLQGNHRGGSRGANDVCNCRPKGCRMNRFDYIRPSSVAEAIEAAIPGSAILAGGTNLVDLMKTGVARPTRVVDITRLPGLDRIEWLGDGGVRIGALVRNSDLAHDNRFARAFPAVAEAVLSGASAQLRN